MKKILLTTIICALLGCTSMPAIAGKCEGGTEFQGTINGHTYCYSKAQMTWWAAVMWCKKQGRELATLDQACASWNGSTGSSSCPNIKTTNLYTYLWTANPSSGDWIYVIHNSNGEILGTNISRHFSYHALCY